MSTLTKRWTRRDMLKSTLALAGCGLVPGAALGLDGTTAANERVTMALIGCGGQGRGDMSNFLGFPDFQVIACCDVVRDHFLAAKRQVDGRYGNSDCET
ncbi:MAG: gfo/Idh/MocA family oxidoreductase, partial [Planctomycetaceae bacterium]|nr:gfo/Idh/MocA family oxidoreductase [Planctomycetaceae bacterium]